ESPPHDPVLRTSCLCVPVSQELRNAHSEEIMGIRREEEMEMSDDEEDENPSKRLRTEENVCDQTQASLKEENDSLRWQLEAYRNEVELLRREQRGGGGGGGGRYDEDPPVIQSSEVQIQLLQKNMHNMQQQLLSLQEQLRSKEAELEEARAEHRYLEGGVASLRDQVSPTERGLKGLTQSPEYGVFLSAGIISTFLHVHPFGANLEYLWSYIQRLDSKVSPVDLQCLMVRLPSMFRQELSGVGATLEKRWKFCGFDSLGSA
uniref:Ecto-NOX disulfide-thiol exchanger 1 n=1 Tax=Cyclopterus lumpus TaxID=8103 RepID=A0A8C3G2E9_CYCLU